MSLRFEEQNLEFQFNEGLHVVKFDETSFYRNHFVKLQGSKAVDFIVASTDTIYFIEVKDLAGHEQEQENKARLKLGSKDSLALEIPLKVRDTLACVMGAYKTNITSETEITPFFDRIRNKNVEIKVILFLEGSFPDQEKVFTALKEDMKKKLKWLTTKVLVENITTTRGKDRFYSVQRLPRNHP